VYLYCNPTKNNWLEIFLLIIYDHWSFLTLLCIVYVNVGIIFWSYSWVLEKFSGAADARFVCAYMICTPTKDVIRSYDNELSWPDIMWQQNIKYIKIGNWYVISSLLIVKNTRNM